MEAIQFQRPDLFQLIFDTDQGIDAIPLNPPHAQSMFFMLVLVAYFITAEGILDVGELMLASFPVSLNFHDSISIEDPW